MALFRKFFYRKPPDGLLEISERVYVFDCCFTTDVPREEAYKVYISGIVTQLQEHFPEASFMVFNFREGECQSQISSILAEYDLTVMDYPRQYEGCPLLTMEMIHHFLRSGESWLSLGQQDVLLMHCEQDGWPVLAFMLAALLVYRKQYPGEQRTLDMIYKQAPRELLHLLSPLNPLPSQLRYLHYISRRNVGLEWPPLDRALTLDCVILRFIPNFDGMGGCRPIFRIYGPDPFIAMDRTPKILFSTPKKNIRFYKQEDCELVKIDIHCHIQGDVVLECISLDEELVREEMMFRVMFNTAFIRSNILMLDRDSIDILWDAKERFPKDFRAEVLLSEMDAGNSSTSLDLPSGEDKEGLPMEAFDKVKEMFNLDWLDLEPDSVKVLHRLASLKSLGADSPLKSQLDAVLEELSPRGLENESNHYPGRLLSSASKKFFSSPSPPQSRVITPRIHVSPSTPTFSSKSLTPSAHATVSRYHSAPSALGIMALLDDQTVSDTCEDTRATKLASSVATSSASGSSIFLKSSQPLPPRSLSLDSASYTKEADPHGASSRPPPPAPSPLIPPGKEASLAPPPPPPPPPLPGSTLAKEASLALPPCQPTQPLSSLSPAVAAAPPPPAPPLPKGILSAPDSAGLKQSTSSPVIPGPHTPSLMTSLSSHTDLLPSRKVTSIVGVPPPPPCPATAAATSAPPPPPPPCPSPAAAPSAPPPPPPPASPSPAAAPSAPPPPPPPASPAPSAPPPPLPPSPANSAPPPPVPPCTSRSLNNANSPGGKGPNCEVIPPPPPGGMNAPAKGKLLRKNNMGRKSNLKPLHWVKVTRAVQGSLWAETQNTDEFSKAPEFDMSELERLFSAAAPDQRRSGSKPSAGPKSDKVHLIDLRRANNCEIMLTKVKMPLNDLMSSVLALDDSVLDGDQVDNLIKFCPTKEEMELLKGYSGDKENLGKCEQYFLELMRIPRVESKLRVFSFKIQFNSQVVDLKNNLKIVKSSSEEIRSSVKLKRIMQTILSLGNALNQGTARGSAVGFRLDSLLKLTDTRARNNKMTLMHYLCKVLAEKLPELLDFHKDLVSLEVAAKMQLKCLAEEMQAVSKGLEKVEQELTASENDGDVSNVFCKTLSDFLVGAEAEVRSLTSLYSYVGRNADSLALYFGEDPARCPFEQVVTTLANFVRMFVRAHDENCKFLELEKKKALKEAEAKAKQSKETED